MTKRTDDSARARVDDPEAGARDRTDSALLLASELHRNQMRKGTQVPYLFHLLAVASLVAEGGGDEDQRIAALLHDAIEDAGGDEARELIRRRFGGEVTRLVDGCTDSDETPKPPWRGRKESYIARLGGADARVRLIAAADKLHNARSVLTDLRAIGEEVWLRFRGGRDGTLWYYRALVQALRNGWHHPLLDELARTVAEIERLAAELHSRPDRPDPLGSHPRDSRENTPGKKPEESGPSPREGDGKHGSQ